MAGIKETKEVLAFILSLGNALGVSMDDGKIDLGDVVNFFDVLKTAPAALTGLDSLVGEISDLDKKEKDELVSFARNKFQIPQKDVEKFLEGALDLAARLFDLVDSMRTPSEISN